MKTIEEKAKAYEDALERASKLRVQNPFDTVSQMMEHVFPELAESEDEKIRKWLIAIVNERCFPACSHCVDQEIGKNAIAWLEKQGEQKPVEWSEEDTLMLEAAISFVEHSSFETIGKGKRNTVVWLRTLKDRYISQPKQEWSEEDKVMLQRAIYYTNYYQTNYADTKEAEECMNWLKSLRPQPKQGWSKEDIEMIDWLIRCCEKEHEELCNDRYGHQDIVSDLKRDCRKKWDWLESLKEKVAPQKRWKPSEEQMEALRVAKAYPSSERREILETLYEDLEQLKAL